MRAPKDADIIDVETHVRTFYDNFGWTENEGVKGEDLAFRIFRPAYYPYHDKVEARTVSQFQPFEGSILIVGCGDMPENHVDIARRFDRTTCIDISQRALDIAEKRLPDSASMVLGSILDSGLEDDTYDAVFCAHVLYHIDASAQEAAMREMIRVTKSGGKIVVIYSNPRSPLRYICSMAKRLNNLFAKVRGREKLHKAETGQDRPVLYFFAHPLGWWSRYAKGTEVAMKPWDVIGSFEERQIIRSDRLARMFYRFSGWLETRFPGAAVKLWQYPMIVLTKKP